MIKLDFLNLFDSKGTLNRYMDFAVNKYLIDKPYIKILEEVGYSLNQLKDRLERDRYIKFFGAIEERHNRMMEIHSRKEYFNSIKNNNIKIGKRRKVR